MLEQHAPHVFTLSTSPHRQRKPPTQQLPRSILKKTSPASCPPSCSTLSSPSSITSPMTSPRSSDFAIPAYHSNQWTVVGIAKAQQRRQSNPVALPILSQNTSLTVTLLYMPTETLYAWPFNLSSPDAKGVCYETYAAGKHDGHTRRPPEGMMSISLRVLADVIRCWMKIRRTRAALAKRGGPESSSISSRLNSSPSSVDDVVDNDEVIDEIVEALDLHPLAPLERSIHLLRQVLPEQPGSPTRSDNEGCLRQRESILTSSGSDSDLDSRHRSEPSVSSRASTVEPSLEDLPSKKTSSPKLPKINTTLPSLSQQNTPSVPQICLVEATPQEAEYEERDRALEKARPISSRNSSFNSRSMDTVHENDSEDDDNNTCDSTLREATPTHDSGEVTFIKIHPCDRRPLEQHSASPKTATPAALNPKEPIAANSERTHSSSPSKVSFPDPFNSLQRSTSKPDIRVETIEYGSPDSLLVSSNKDSVDKSSKTESSRRPSFEGLRAMFGSIRSKSQYSSSLSSY
ncbi:hypothetical protein NDA10_000578 [Ustilago hordei]|nr:hypothetical protein NDA10_000578 [Ustilago hordei]